MNGPNRPNGPDGPDGPDGPNEPNGQTCPECAAPRRPDGTPSCGCTRRASQALRDARTAEAAAAEDFDPLRIRPYVELGSGQTDDTMRLGAVPPDETMPLAAVPAASPPALDGPPRATAPPQTERPRRRRRGLLLPAAGAVVTVVAAAGFASGLFSYNPPERDGALPEDIRASVPEESSPTGTPAPASTASTASPSPAVKPSPSRSPSPSPSASSASPTPSPSATPTATPTTLPATASASPTAPNDGTRRRADVLRPGDKGPEVTELQLRLSQLNLYWGPANGTYDTQVENAVQNYQLTRGVTEDEPGVYGTATRAKLESETRKP